MSKNSGQKFISRNRSPRVQIEYDVEIYGEEKKIELPFIMGVFSDLVGKSTIEQANLNDRTFMEIDVDNFDDRMRSIKPRAAFIVDNTLTDDGGKIAIDLEFNKMEDFSPDQIAKNVEPLRELLEARIEMANLLTYMDGKTGAEELIDKILSDNTLLKSLASMPKQKNNSDES